jgi:hypothetical protein
VLKLVWRVKQVAELRPGEVTETEVACVAPRRWVAPPCPRARRYSPPDELRPVPPQSRRACFLVLGPSREGRPFCCPGRAPLRCNCLWPPDYLRLPHVTARLRTDPHASLGRERPKVVRLCPVQIWTVQNQSDAHRARLGTVPARNKGSWHGDANQRVSILRIPSLLIRYGGG